MSWGIIGVVLIVAGTIIQLVILYLIIDWMIHRSNNKRHKNQKK
jgi:phage shock protein PspC (stress-responsive transcriptional regulator)